MIRSADTDQEGELPAAVCIPPLHCPSLTTVWLEGRASASLIQSLVLPNNLTGIFINACRPMSGSEFGNFSTCLCQSTSLECFMWDSVALSAHEEKELVSALEQISSLKMVMYNDTAILTDVGIRQIKQAMSSSAVIQGFNDRTYDKKELEDMLSELSNGSLHSLLSDQDSSQQPALVTAADTLASSSHHSADSNDEQK